MRPTTRKYSRTDAPVLCEQKFFRLAFVFKEDSCFLDSFKTFKTLRQRFDVTREQEKGIAATSFQFSENFRGKDVGKSFVPKFSSTDGAVAQFRNVCQRLKFLTQFLKVKLLIYSNS